MQAIASRPKFTRWTALIGGIAVLSLTSARTDDAHLPEAATLLDAHVEATGGKAAHLKLKTRRRIGTLAVDLAGHAFEAKVDERYVAPDKWHMLIDGEFFSQVTACNGKNAWEWRPGHRDGDRDASTDPGETHLLEGPEKSRALERSRFHSAVQWREKFESVKTLGVVDVRDKPAFEVRVKPMNGEPYSVFYDRSSGLLVKSVRTSTSHGEKLDMETFVGDYREFDGVRIATRVESHLNSPEFGKGTQIWTYTKITHDEEIPASVFAMPEGITTEEAHDHPPEKSRE